MNTSIVSPAKPVSTTINRTWFKNQMRNGNLLVKHGSKLSDDYAYDASINFGRTNDFAPAKPDLFDDWYMSVIRIWGDKNGIINVSFASCEFYDFKVKK